LNYLLIILIAISGVYLISQLAVIIGFIKLKNKQLDNKSSLKISVIVPVRNEENNIKLCLQSLLAQNYSSEDYEIIVVNDYCEDDTVSVITKLNSSQIRIIDLKKGSGKKEALKFGIENSQYDIILTTDADCTLPDNWLKQVVNSINGETDMILGPIVLSDQAGFLNAFQQLDMMAMQGVEFGWLNFNQPILNNAANLAFKKGKYNEVKGYDNYETPSGDDVFLLEKFKERDFKIKGVLHHDFIVETKPSLNIKMFINQRLRWASKSKFYKDKMIIFYALIIVLQNFIQLFIYYHVLFIEKFRMIYIILLLTKWLIDFILLFLVATFFKRRSSLLYFIPVQLIYPLYIMGISVASNFMKYEWKGRKY